MIVSFALVRARMTRKKERTLDVLAVNDRVDDRLSLYSRRRRCEEPRHRPGIEDKLLRLVEGVSRLGESDDGGDDV